MGNCKHEGKVLVTGATGYLASHIIQILLSEGYTVVGTVRSLANKDKYAFLYKLKNADTHLQLREADLVDKGGWDTALNGIAAVIHTASPIPPSVPKDQNEVIIPAVQGTRTVIEASLKNKVRRIVFTSSCLTVCVRKDDKSANQTDWSDQELLHHYPKSKYLAQKLFWEYGDKHKDQMDFISVLPSLVIGPVKTKQNNSSQAFVADILNGLYPGIPTPATTYSIVDVRDAALGHVRALQHPEAKGQRYIISGDTLNTVDLFGFLREKYEKEGYPIAKNEIDVEGIKKSGHGPSLRTLGLLGKKISVDNSKGIKQLGMKYRTAKQSLLDMAESLIAVGTVKKS